MFFNKKYTYFLDSALIDNRAKKYIERTFQYGYNFQDGKIYIENNEDYNNLVVYLKIANKIASIDNCNGCNKNKGCC